VVIETELVISDLLPQARRARIEPGEIAALAKSIKAEGLRFPIIVHDGVVLNGLKRIEAYKILKRDKIPTRIPASILEVAPELEAQREGSDGLSTIGRTVELAEALQPLQAAWIRDRRIRAGQARSRGIVNETNPGMRVMLAQALGMSEGRVEILKSALQKEDVDPDLRAHMDLVRKGLATLYSLQSWLYNRKRMRLLPLVSAEEAREVSERALRSMGAAVEAINKFGSMDMLTRSEREQVAIALRDHRAAIGRLASKINTSIREEMAKETLS
jgi:hypothetical protein